MKYQPMLPLVRTLAERVVATVREAVRDTAQDRAEGSASRLPMFLLAAALMTATMSGWAEQPIGSHPRAYSTAQAKWVGVFTGQHVNGVPVYRYGPDTVVTVVADRKTELAKLEREEHSARAKQARSKLAARPPA